MTGRIFAAAFALLAGIACAQAQSATDVGEHLFNGSGSTTGKVSIGATEIGLNAKRFACRNCHRRDGAGGSEGRAPPIDWNSLSTVTAVRPTYDRRSFAAALKDGVAPGGRPLDSSMPRYDLPAAVIGDLVGYLAALPQLQRRGITRRSLTFGVVIAPDNRAPSQQYYSYLEKALRQQVGDVKLFDRVITIKPLEGTSAEILSEAERSVAAVVGLVPSSQVSVGDLTARNVPVLFPVTLLRGDEDTSLVRSFLPSLDRQVDALVERAVMDGRKRIGVVLPDDDSLLMQSLEVPGPGVDLVPLTVPPIPKNLDALVLTGAVSHHVAKMLKAMPVHTALYGVAGKLPGLPDTARQRHAELTLVNGYIGIQDSGTDAENLLATHAKVSAALIKSAMLSVGRSGATRASLVASFDRIAFPNLGLDYSRFPLTGSGRVSFLTFSAEGR